MVTKRNASDDRGRKRARAHFKKLLVAQGYLMCGRCGRVILPDMRWHAGHIVPHVVGGLSSLDNLRPEHERCNTADGGRLGGAIRRAKNPPPAGPSYSFRPGPPPRG